MLPIVVGGVLAVGAVVFAVQYFQSNSVPKVVAKSADPHKARGRPGPRGHPNQRRRRRKCRQRIRPTVSMRTWRPKPDPLTEPAPVRSKETSTATAPQRTRIRYSSRKLRRNPNRKQDRSRSLPGPEKKLDPTPNASRIAVPDEAAHGRAVQLLQETYHDDLAKARSNVQKASVAQRCFVRPGPTRWKRILRGGSCCWRRAAPWRKRPTIRRRTLETIDLTARCYLVDGWLKKTDLLAEMADGQRLWRTIGPWLSRSCPWCRKRWTSSRSRSRPDWVNWPWLRLARPASRNCSRGHVRRQTRAIRHFDPVSPVPSGQGRTPERPRQCGSHLGGRTLQMPGPGRMGEGASETFGRRRSNFAELAKKETCRPADARPGRPWARLVDCQGAIGHSPGPSSRRVPPHGMKGLAPSDRVAENQTGEAAR